MPEFDWFRDTDPLALEVFLKLQREMPAAQKVTVVFEMSDLLLQLARTGVRMRHPEADEREIFLRAAAQRLDRETMIRAYGWDPKDHP